MSVASLQVTFAVVVVTSVTTTFVGADGASVSAAFFVVNVYTAPSETLPAASTAFTVTLYSVPAVRLSSVLLQVSRRLQDLQIHLRIHCIQSRLHYL